MGIRVEWAEAAYTTVSIATAGQPVGEDEISSGKYGLTIGGDSAHVVEGSADELRALAARIAEAVKDLPPAATFGDVRASELPTSGASHFRDYGDEGWTAIVTAEHGEHDNVLVTDDDGDGYELDIDTVVQALIPAKVA